MKIEFWILKNPGTSLIIWHMETLSFNLPHILLWKTISAAAILARKAADKHICSQLC